MDPETLALLRDVAALLPVAAHLHPDDLDTLQTRVCDAIARAEAIAPLKAAHNG